MKISLTSKNNIKHFSILIVLLAILVLVAVTNARYETVATLDAQANFPTTILEISSSNELDNYELDVGEDMKLQYIVTNKKNSKTNNNNLQYYLDLLDSNGNTVPSINIKIRQKPSTEDNATYDTAVSLGYVNGKGYGPITLKNDGTEDTKTFEVFVKANNVSQSTTFNLKMQAYAESITNNEYNIVRTADLQLMIVYGGKAGGGSQLFVYTTTENVAKIIGISNEGQEQLASLTKLEIPETYNKLPVTEINVGNSLKNKTNLTEIVIPSTVTSLAKNTFSGCSNITKITCPLSLDMSNVFDNTTNKVEDVIFTADAKNTDGFDYTSDTYKTTPWYYSKDLKEEKNKEENNNQNNEQEEKLKTINITFDKAITSIGNYTFKDLERLDTTIAKLLVFDKTLTEIGTYAFNNTKLTGSVSVGKTGITEVVGEKAFDSSITINIIEEPKEQTEQPQEQQPANTPATPNAQENQNPVNDNLNNNNNNTNANSNTNTGDEPKESESGAQNNPKGDTTNNEVTDGDKNGSNEQTNEDSKDNKEQTEAPKEITNEIQNTII